MALSLQEKRELLDLARSAVEAKCRDEPHLFEIPYSEHLRARTGAFVTHYVNHNLFGCIGYIESDSPLYETVIQSSVAAGFKDPRFPGIRLEQLDDLSIEISVLSKIEAISGPDDIEIDRHGVYIKREDRHGLLLPQVASKNHWDAQTFLNQVCVKAGFEAPCWLEADTQVYRFTADIFSEGDLISA